MLGELSAGTDRETGQGPQVPAAPRRPARRPDRVPHRPAVVPGDGGGLRHDAARRRSRTSPRSSASPRCCRSTPAASASWPATTSRRRATSASRSSASACSTAPATSGSRCPPMAGSSSTTRPSTRAGCRSARSPTPTARRHASRSRCPKGRTLHAQIWVANVGRVPLLLLDSDVEENDTAARQVTDRLYGGGPEHRLEQELLLGIGGVRAIRAYCAATGARGPEVYHSNEGHAGFLGVERIRETRHRPTAWTSTRLCRPCVRAWCSRRTPRFPAGIDRFSRDLVAAHLGNIPGVPLERILDLGREDDPAIFNMAHLGLRIGQRANGVSSAARRREPRHVRRALAGLRRGRGADQLGHQRCPRADLDGARDLRDRRARGRPRPARDGRGLGRDRQGQRQRADRRPAPAAVPSRRGDPPPAARVATSSAA